MSLARKLADEAISAVQPLSTKYKLPATLNVVEAVILRAMAAQKEHDARLVESLPVGVAAYIRAKQACVEAIRSAPPPETEMSNRPCNFCLVTNLRREANKTGATIHVIPKPLGIFPDGVDVFVVPKDAQLDKIHWTMWAASLSDRCMC